MEIKIQYLNDKDGKVNAVQIPIKDWKWLQSKLSLLSKELNLKNDLKQALSEVSQLQKDHSKKQTLSEFIAEL